MNQSFHLVTDEIRANCIGYISQLESGKGWLVSIKSEKEARSDAQSRLRWVWFGFMEKELAGVGKGRTKEQWNLYYKHKYMRELLIAQDEDFVPFFENYDDTCDRLRGTPLLAEYQKQWWESVARTEFMTTKTFSEWMDLVEKDVNETYGLVLPVPGDLEWLREK